MRTARGFVFIAVVLTAIIATSVAQAKVVTKRASAGLGSGGTVNASVSYTKKSYYDTGTTLTIDRAGQKLFSAPVTATACKADCSVEAISAVDLQGNGEPVVMVDLFTDGAHCCSVTNFYTYDAGTQTYRPYEYNWGDPGYRLRTLGGKKVFESADDRFAYAFTDFAASGMPIEFLSFNGTRLVNTTSSHPQAVAADAARYLKAFKAQSRQKYDDTTGVVAAWAADEDALNNSAQVAMFLQTQAQAHHLNTEIPGLPENAAFVTKLDAFLKKTGYLT